MRSIERCSGWGLLLAIMTLSPATAEVQLLPGSAPELDQATINEVLIVFHEVYCTGSLSGLSKTSGLRVPIDSWYEEVHYMTFEDGRWRISGNVDDQPRIMPFGTSPHLLFLGEGGLCAS